MEILNCCKKVTKLITYARNYKISTYTFSKNHKSFSTQTVHNPIIDSNTNVAKDVILFKHENQRFFKFLNLFALCQFGFWTYLSFFAFTSMKDAPVPRNQDESTPWWRKINLGENKYRNSLTVISFLIGYGILVSSWMFTLRSVRYLILRKGGRDISIITYTPFGNNRLRTVSLKDVSAQESREFAKVNIPIKVRDTHLFYLIDMKGEFLNPILFDQTAGLKRLWKN